MWDAPVLYDLENADAPAFDLPFWSGLLESLRPRRMLELACGTGRLTLPLARLGIADEIVGLGSSAPVLARPAPPLPAGGPPPPSTRVSFVEGDMRSPSLAGTFDLVAIPFNSL